ncbi:MAG: UDP-N-acetylglucosamine--N-acetylmuramyl-(pentapeptide) pyrophosphoryl-undecaprenol N-acetylglucosamine transferase [Puniceicoccales bacterium]|nr:UDP-N-acetylglucosamine--N-acetylmuramyl-(pentapeptide) pyrophosphoryl-undecaprenol N-acetylglucosamine transferase [Puniceicoccales bacterium]
MGTFAIVCGGTGGHLSPGIATAQELTQRGHRCVLIVSQKAVDKDLVAAYPEFEYFPFPGVGFSLTPWRGTQFVYLQWKNFFRALQILKQLKADAVIGFGGFLMGGILLAAWWRHLPIFLHEANRVPGKAIRFLKFLADRIYLPEGVPFKARNSDQVKRCGFPLRKEFRPLPKTEARRILKLPPDSHILLVMGGSQGARTLTQWVVENAEPLGRRGFYILCLTGTGDRRKDLGNVTFIPFTHRVNILLCAADLVVSRAGAGSIAELIQCTVPSILIPLPHSADHHQYANAKTVEDEGGCVLLEQKDLSHLAEEVGGRLTDSAWLTLTRHRLAQLRCPDVVQRMVDDMEALLNHGKFHKFKKK